MLFGRLQVGVQMRLCCFGSNCGVALSLYRFGHDCSYGCMRATVAGDDVACRES